MSDADKIKARAYVFAAEDEFGTEEDIEGEDRRWSSIGFMIIVFFGTIIVAKGMKMQLPSSDRKKIVTQALGSYVFLYLFIWILTNTIVNVGTVTNGMPSLLP